MLSHIIYNSNLLYELVLEKQTVINHISDSPYTNALHWIIDPAALWHQALKA